LLRRASIFWDICWRISSRDVLFRIVEEAGPRCPWCRRPVAARSGPGRPRLYCRRSCRQRAFEHRRRLQELGLTEAELVVARRDLDALHDALYVLEAAIEDVDQDLARSRTKADVEAALAWLLAAARPLASRHI
jgi:hypothetical protein